ncbi:MAG: UDP-N-acetylmuramoyl-L-alanine--D-glutamate ligase [Candidatus Curtissbacteria bacterium]|nr:UDP-N-acetylmuramoyl-L-alanine--D-glutamate ligase [Candidatus Curtissbacteria bacterium]
MFEEFKDKNILILGAGREGFSALKLLRKIFPRKRLTICDEKNLEKLDKEIQEIVRGDKNLEANFGKHYLDFPGNIDLIIKSPGIPRKKLGKISAQITSATKIFFKYCKGTIIGITGTKGKSTTSSLVYKILKDNGFNVELVGNIGKPAIIYLDAKTEDKIFIYELSSFQLEDLRQSPHIGVILNIYEEHLDYHESFEDYKKSKVNITRWQKPNDFLIYNFNADLKAVIISQTKAQKIPFSISEAINDGYSIENDWIVNATDGKKEKIMSLDNINLIGKFNLNNVIASIAVTKIFGIENRKIEKSVKSFKPLEHRLQLVGTFRGITFYNDSIATNPGATIAAMDALGDNLQTIILGGYERGLNFDNLATELINSKVENTILFPVTGKRIKEAILTQKPDCKIHFYDASNMSEAVALACSNTQEGKICLLSPASPSFNMFKNYEDRGRQFAAEVNKLT